MNNSLPIVVLKTSIKKVFRRMLSIIIFTTVILMLFYDFFPPWNTKLESIIVGLTLGALPDIILLIEYLIYTIKIDRVEFTETRIVVFYKNGLIYNYEFEELEVIELYKSAGMDKGNFAIYSNERFYFANIKAKDGKNIILTSLLGPDLSDALDTIKNVPVERTRTGYAFIFRNA